MLLRVALVGGALVVFFLLGRLYLSWMVRRYGFREDYLNKRRNSTETTCGVMQTQSSDQLERLQKVRRL